MITLLQRILREPSPDDLWVLQPHLLALGTPEADAARDLAGKFYEYLSQVRSKLASKEFSTQAAKLAAGAVGVISAQEFIESLADDRHKAINSLLGGGLASVLEVMSTYQHIRAWESEFASEHETAVWNLYAAMWCLSTETQPDLSSEQRHALIDQLLSVARDPAVNSAARLVLVISLFQILLAIRLAALITVSTQSAG